MQVSPLLTVFELKSEGLLYPGVLRSEVRTITVHCQGQHPILGLGKGRRVLSQLKFSGCPPFAVSEGNKLSGTPITFEVRVIQPAATF